MIPEHFQFSKNDYISIFYDKHRQHCYSIYKIDTYLLILTTNKNKKMFILLDT